MPAPYPSSPQRVYTIAEAAELCGPGVTPKAIRSRCDRGQLRHVKRGGVRLIPLSELVRAGLILPPAEGQLELDEAGEPTPVAELVHRELLVELARAHERIGELQALERNAASLAAAHEAQLRAELELERDRAAAARGELEQARAELDELRAGRRWRPWRRHLLGSTTARL